MKSVVASSTIWGQRPGEAPFEIHLQIGTPYQVATDPEEWACPLALTPLFERSREAHGSCAFQALCLASSLALDRLHEFKEKGGALYLAPGEDFPFEAYAFGVASRKGDS